MFNRISAVLFILIASIGILANVVIPHHHHENEVCVEQSHCSPHQHETEHESKDDHKHDSENKSEQCVFNPIFLLPANHVRQEKISSDISDKKYNSKLYQSYVHGLELINLTHNFFHIAITTLSATSYTQFLMSYGGMRAPPISISLL